jgi:cytochrome bd-type quinol oxidase subunit 2
VMTVAALIVAPIVLLYQAWTYHVLRERVGGGVPTAEGGPPAEARARP